MDRETTWGHHRIGPNAHMSMAIQHIHQAPEGFSDHSRLILSRTRSTVHDTAKGDEELNLYLGEQLLDRVVACLVEKYSDDGYSAEDLTTLLHRTLEDWYASEGSVFTVTLRLFLAQIRVRTTGQVEKQGDDEAVITLPFVCTPYDLRDLSVVMAEFPPRISGDQRLFQGLLLTHYEWVERKSHTLSARPGLRERRRQVLYKRRCAACNIIPGLTDFSKRLDDWGIEVVSEDESSGEDSGYSITRIIWRSAAATSFMRSLDAIYLSSRYKDGKCGRGSVPRERYPSLRHHSVTPKPGLPLNFYNKSWWECLGEDEKRLLDAKESLNLELSEEVKRIVNRFQFQGVFLPNVDEDSREGQQA